MEIFETIIPEIDSFIIHHKNSIKTNCDEMKHYSWPGAENRNYISGDDIAIELGHPKTESISMIIWTNKRGVVADGNITILGRDISEAADTVGNNCRQLPFGRILLIGGEGFDEDNSYKRYREMESQRYDISLRGYMMRTVPQEMREWSRISKEAIAEGFSLFTLAQALINRYKSLKYIQEVEVVCSIHSDELIKKMRVIGDKAIKIVGAMQKFDEEELHDCSSCNYDDVCSEVSELRKMRERKL